MVNNPEATLSPPTESEGEEKPIILQRLTAIIQEKGLKYSDLIKDNRLTQKAKNQVSRPLAQALLEENDFDHQGIIERTLQERKALKECLAEKALSSNEGYLLYSRLYQSIAGQMAFRARKALDRNILGLTKEEERRRQHSPLWRVKKIGRSLFRQEHHYGLTDKDWQKAARTDRLMNQFDKQTPQELTIIERLTGGPTSRKRRLILGGSTALLGTTALACIAPDFLNYAYRFIQGFQTPLGITPSDSEARANPDSQISPSKFKDSTQSEIESDSVDQEPEVTESEPIEEIKNLPHFFISRFVQHLLRARQRRFDQMSPEEKTVFHEGIENKNFFTIAIIGQDATKDREGHWDPVYQAPRTENSGLADQVHLFICQFNRRGALEIHHVSPSRELRIPELYRPGRIPQPINTATYFNLDQRIASGGYELQPPEKLPQILEHMSGLPIDMAVNFNLDGAEGILEALFPEGLEIEITENMAFRGKAGVKIGIPTESAVQYLDNETGEVKTKTGEFQAYSEEFLAKMLKNPEFIEHFFLKIRGKL